MFGLNIYAVTANSYTVRNKNVLLAFLGGEGARFS
jgi:hypothetical protein